jgi:hypothetical protein
MLVTAEAAPDAPGRGFNLVFRVEDHHFLYRAGDNGKVQMVDGDFEFSAAAGAWHKVESITISPPSGLVGDYDANGRVDEQDAAVWRASVGAWSLTEFLAADGNRDGTVDAADYVVWRKFLGNTAFNPEPAALSGDYNLDETVDAADYVVWRKTLGTTGVPAYSGADGDGDGTIDQDDFNVWKAHFGQTLPGAGSGTGAATESVEPVAPQLLAVVSQPVESSSNAQSPEAHQPQTVVSEPVTQVEHATADENSASLQGSESKRAVESRRANAELLAPHSSRATSPRPAARATFGAVPALAARRRDEALVAWLALQPDTERRSGPFEEANTWKDEDKRNTDHWQLDSVDQVFERLNKSST